MSFSIASHCNTLHRVESHHIYCVSFIKFRLSLGIGQQRRCQFLVTNRGVNLDSVSLTLTLTRHATLTQKVLRHPLRLFPSAKHGFRDLSHATYAISLYFIASSSFSTLALAATAAAAVVCCCVDAADPTPSASRLGQPRQRAC